MRAERKKRGVAATLLATLWLGGCSGVIDPYVKLDPIRPPPSADQTQWAAPSQTLNGSRVRAVNLADDYLGAAEHQALITTGLASVLIPANAVAFYHTATTPKVNTTLAPAIGFASAAALGLGGILRSPTREGVYVEGYAAVLCSLSASDPYLVSKTDYEAYLLDTRLTADIGAVKQDVLDLAAVQTAYNQFQAPSSKNAATQTAIDDAVSAGQPLAAQALAAQSAASDALTAADATLTAQNAERGNVDSASLQLEGRLGAITVQVDRQVQHTEVGMDQLKSALAAAALSSTQAAAALVTTTSTPPAAKANGAMALVRANMFPQARALAEPTDRLNAAVATLNFDVAATNRFLARQADFEKTAGQMGACSVAALSVLTATTPSAPLTADGKSVMDVSVQSPQGQGAPSAKPDSSDFTVKIIALSGYAYTVEVTAPSTATNGAHTLTVTSADGLQHVDVKFQVTGGAAAAAAAAPRRLPRRQLPRAPAPVAASAAG